MKPNFFSIFFAKKFASPKICRIFAPNLSMTPTNQVFIVAAFFIFAFLSNSIDCCPQTGSRCEALLSVSMTGFNSLFLFNSFLISQMTPTVKDAVKANNSTLTRASAHETGKKHSFQSNQSTSVDPTPKASPSLRRGKVHRPNLILGDLLNFVDHATYRQLQIIYNSCRVRVEQPKVRRAAL